MKKAIFIKFLLFRCGDCMKCGNVINLVVEYIEVNLDEPLTLDDLAEHFKYSKYYFHRIFKSEIGYNIYDYIRRRRLVSAAKLLIHTDLRIIDIAYSYQFNSHEAFTRSFQQLYHQTPSQYRVLMKELINVKKEKILMDTPIEGWTFTGTDVDKYKMEKDYLDSNQSDYSIRISSNFTDIDPSHDFSNLMQTFQAKLFLEKRMRLSAFIKSEDVEGWSGLWMRIDDKAYEMVGFDNMSNRPIKGSTSWNHYSCVLDIPKESMNINIGVILAGSGKIWIDDFSFDEVDDSISTTDIREAEDTFPEKPVNLEFK